MLSNDDYEATAAFCLESTNLVKAVELYMIII